MMLAAGMGYCVYTSFLKYEFSYTANIGAQDIGYIKEIYLPLPSTKRESCMEAIKQKYLNGDFSLDMVETENGQMLEISRIDNTLNSILPIVFRQTGVSYNKIQIKPKHDFKSIAGDDEKVQVFETPLKINVSDNMVVTK